MVQLEQKRIKNRTYMCVVRGGFVLKKFEYVLGSKTKTHAIVKKQAKCYADGFNDGSAEMAGMF